MLWILENSQTRIRTYSKIFFKKRTNTENTRKDYETLEILHKLIIKKLKNTKTD